MISQGDRVEKTELWITCEKPLEGDGRAVRGFFGNLYRNRPEFHHHISDTLIYRHSSLQLKPNMVPSFSDRIKGDATSQEGSYAVDADLRKRG